MANDAKTSPAQSSDAHAQDKRAELRRAALEYHEFICSLGYFLDGLHARGAGADDSHSLPSEIDRMLWPQTSMEGLAAKAVHTWEIRQCRSR